MAHVDLHAKIQRYKEGWVLRAHYSKYTLISPNQFHANHATLLSETNMFGYCSQIISMQKDYKNNQICFPTKLYCMKKNMIISVSSTTVLVLKGSF